MAITTIHYTNSSLGRRIRITFDTTAHVVTAFLLIEPSTVAQPAILYTDITGNLIPINVAPYARWVPIGSECLAGISSTPVTNASTNIASDGTITVNAYGLEILRSYSKDGGLTFQSSNIFTGLAAGTYNIVVSTGWDGTCRAYATVVVGFDALVCDLTLGSIITSEALGANGKIKILTINGGAGGPVEYRIDSGVWQDSAEFTGLVAGTYNVQVRYVNYPTCTDNRDVEVSETEGCDLFIDLVKVTHEQTKFGRDGAITIVATGSGTGFQYSIDNGATYQDSNSFYPLSPGVYNLRVIDDAGCFDFKSVELFSYKVPYIDIPRANSNRFVITQSPLPISSIQNFDNTLFRNMEFPGVIPECYEQKIQRDTVPLQFRSSFLTHKLEVFQIDNTLVDTIVPQKVKSFINKSYTLACYLCDYGLGKSQVFFEDGLPDFAVIGQGITLTDTGYVALDGDFIIEDIKPGILSATGFVVLIVSAVFPTVGIVQANVTAIYDVQPFDVFEANINWAAYNNGSYYLLLTGDDPQFASFIAESEPLLLATKHSNCLKFTYSNIENDFKIFYDTGIKHIEYIEGDLKNPVPGGQRTTMEDSKRRLIKLQENVTRTLTLRIIDITPYLAEKLSLILAMDTVQINDVDYATEDSVEPEYLENEAMCNAKVKVRQIDFEAENSDDGDVDVPVQVLEVNGVLLRINP